MLLDLLVLERQIFVGSRKDSYFVMPMYKRLVPAAAISPWSPIHVVTNARLDLHE